MQAKSKNQSYQQIEGPDQKVREQIKKLNLRILQKSFPYICSILVTLQYGVQARYNIEAKFWSYLKIKGPVFLAEDKYKRMEIIIMNQCEIENSTIKIPQGTKFQLKQLQNGYLLSCLKHDSQTGYIIQAIWTADNRVQEIYKILLKGVKSE